MTKFDREEWTTNPVLKTLAFSYDPGDRWGSVMGGWFGIANVLHCEGTKGVPDRWHYSPGAGASSVDPDCYPDAELLEGLRAGDWTEDDLIAAGDVLAEEAEALKAAGEDY